LLRGESLEFGGSRGISGACASRFLLLPSIFLARQRLFPHFMRTSGTLYVLSFLPLIVMIFWLYRVRGTRALSSLLVRDTTFSAAASDQK
jgi:hypothetical protein